MAHDHDGRSLGRGVGHGKASEGAALPGVGPGGIGHKGLTDANPAGTVRTGSDGVNRLAGAARGRTTGVLPDDQECDER
ncbi:hypothetical protein CUD01_16940 [Cellulomonas uda]|uniref:Uncharacterized protein n=1 Tax=Cellulomonas uda TaxID=1714 RepID=A0A4Y3KEA2_CELUD|nr:hypothetical protein CUD01_16940 [Cellulomonas uda]